MTVTDAVAMANAQKASELGHIEAAVTLDQATFTRRIGEHIGRRKAAEALGKLVTVTSLIELQEIKSSKLYRGMRTVGIHGELVTCHDWATFCEQVVGCSVEKVDTDLRNLKQFGADFMEAAQQMGIGYRELREMRAIPTDQRTELIELAKAGDKGAVLDFAESLLERHASAVEELKKSHAKVEKRKDQDLQAKDRIIDELNERLGIVEDQKDDRPQEVIDLERLHGAGRNADIALRVFAKDVADLMKKYQGQGPDDVAAQALRYVVRVIGDLAVQHGIEILDPNELAPAPWMTPAGAEVNSR